MIRQGLNFSPFFIALKCLIFDKRKRINEMSNIPPFEQILGLGLIGTLTSILDINESLKFLILFLTFSGLVIKLWEQIKKSEFFLTDIKNIARKIFRKNGKG